MIYFFLFFLFPFLGLSAEGHQSLKINLFTIRNGVGLDTDGKVLCEVFQRLGHSVVCINYGEKCRKRKADVNIFLEHPQQDKLSCAKLNWLIPNPEWYTQEIKLLDEMDLILCRTQEVQRIFHERHYPTYYLGFTSPDCSQIHIKQDFSRCFHLAGRSHQKGTASILAAWISNPYYPHLTLIKHFSDWIISLRNLKYISTYVSESELRQLQNQCGIHLCPSETEGFGHYIMEAMSVGAVVVTTDAPPMNEFIKDRRCLVPFIRSSPQRLGINYYVDPSALKKKINDLTALSEEELQGIGRQNRANYLQRREEFYEKLEQLLWKTACECSS